MKRRAETVFTDLLMASRWLMAPLYVGLVGAIVVVALEFFRELAEAFIGFAQSSASGTVLVVLKLIDLVLIGHLAFIMLVAGVELLANLLQARRMAAI